MKTLIFALLFIPLSAQAQKKEIQMDFENESIEGKINSPELEILMAAPKIHHGRLIKLRENFLSEMEQTVQAVK